MLAESDMKSCCRKLCIEMLSKMLDCCYYIVKSLKFREAIYEMASNVNKELTRPIQYAAVTMLGYIISCTFKSYIYIFISLLEF